MGRAPRVRPASQQKRLPAQRRNHPYLHVHEHKLYDVPTLGALRDAFEATNGPPSAFSDSSRFEVITFDHHDPTRHHLLHGMDGGILGYYVPPEFLAQRLATDFLSTLQCLVKDLPSIGKTEEDKNAARRRGIPNSRTYASSRGYRAENILEYSARFKKDNAQGGKGSTLVQHCQPLWNIAGLIYKKIAKKSSEDIDHHDILIQQFHLAPLAKPFTALTINCGSLDSPVVSQPHRDVKDAYFQMSCLFPFGNFEEGQGDVILWELRKIIRLRPGSLFFFPAHLITHSNTPVTAGERHSLVAYTREEIKMYYVKQGLENVRTRLPVK
jgi:Oxygenase domain of the 2OGFeDO superfamily